MSRDETYQKRDILLARMDENIIHIKDTMNKQSVLFDTHVIQDATEFKNLKKRIFYITVAVVVIGVIIGGPSLAFMLIK